MLESSVVMGRRPSVGCCDAESLLCFSFAGTEPPSLIIVRDNAGR